MATTRYDVNEVVLIRARVLRIDISPEGTSYLLRLEDTAEPVKCWMDEDTMPPVTEEAPHDH